MWRAVEYDNKDKIYVNPAKNNSTTSFTIVLPTTKVTIYVEENGLKTSTKISCFVLLETQKF